MRGDRFALAICTVMSRTEKKKTTNVSMAPEISPTAAREPSKPNARKRKFSSSSKRRVRGANAIAASMATTGTIHNEVLRNPLSLFRWSHDIVSSRCTRPALGRISITLRPFDWLCEFQANEKVLNHQRPAFICYRGSLFTGADMLARVCADVTFRLTRIFMTIKLPVRDYGAAYRRSEMR